MDIKVKRIILMFLKNLLMAPYWFIKICIYGRLTKYTEQQRFDLLKTVVKNANLGGRVKIEASGFENLPKKNGYVMYPNHQGLYDVLAFIEVHPQPLTVVMKKEVSNIPGLKQVFRALKAHEIDRDDIKQSMKVILEVTEEVKQGRNFIIFAEGTRSKEGNKIQNFKGGSFKSAVKAKAPIVPVAIMDAYKVFDTSSIKPVKVKLHYLKPLYYDDYKEMKTTEIAKFVRDAIEKEIEHESKQTLIL